VKWDAGPLDAEQTLEWVNRYQRHSRLYAWGFFVLLQPVVFVVIWLSMGELNKDVFLSLAFFSLVTFILAVITRRKAAKSWRGIVVDKGVRQRRIRSGDSSPDRIETYHEVVFQTNRGKKVKMRCGPSYFEHMGPGDEAVKVPGYDWPVKAVIDDGGQRACLACGGLIGLQEGNCPRCRAPVPHLETLTGLVR
jgi:hypothetical protein